MEPAKALDKRGEILYLNDCLIRVTDQLVTYASRNVNSLFFKEQANSVHFLNPWARGIKGLKGIRAKSYDGGENEPTRYHKGRKWMHGRLG